MNTELQDAVRERDAYFADAARVKDTLSAIIPALELASGLKADEFRQCTPGELTPDEVAALWLSRAILEGHALEDAHS